MYYFLNRIIKSVELSVKSKKYIDFESGDYLEERIPQREFFIVYNDSLLIEDDIETFKSFTSSNYNNRLSYMISQKENLIQIQNFRKWVFSKNSQFLNFHSKINYKYLHIMSFCIVIIVNLSLQWNLTQKIKYNIIWPFWINVAHCCLIFYFICVYSLFYYWRKNVFSKKKLRRKTRFSKAMELLSGVTNSEIWPLLWNFFFGVLVIILNQIYFLYAIQVFSIFNLFDTMKLAVKSIWLRWDSFVAVFILIIILILAFNSVGFYFLQTLYSDQIDENLCHLHVLTAARFSDTASE